MALPPITANLVAQLDANDEAYSDAGSTLAGDTDGVQEWHDQVNVDVFEQTTAADQPTYHTGVTQGNPVLRFDGAGDLLSEATARIPSDADFTAFIVMDPAQTPDGEDRAIFLLISPDTLWYVTTDFGGASNQMRLWNTDLGEIVVGNDVRGAWGVHVLRRSGDDWEFYHDGTLGGSNTLAGSLGSYSPTEISASRSSRFYEGDLGEILIYDAALSDTDRATVEDHLDQKWITGGGGGGLSIPVGTVSFNLDPGTSLGVLREFEPVQFDLSPQALTPAVETVIPLGTVGFPLVPQALTPKTAISLPLGTVEFPLAPQTLNVSVGGGPTATLGTVSFNLSPQDISWQRIRDLGVVQFPFLAQILNVSGGGGGVRGGSPTTGITHITDVGTI